MDGIAAQGLLKIRFEIGLWLNGNARGFNTENFTLDGAATAYSLSLDTDRTGDPSGESHWRSFVSSVSETEGPSLSSWVRGRGNGTVNRSAWLVAFTFSSLRPCKVTAVLHQTVGAGLSSSTS